MGGGGSFICCWQMGFASRLSSLEDSGSMNLTERLCFSLVWEGSFRIEVL